MKQPVEVDEFAARLRMLKERAGLSFEELASRTGVARSSLHRYCSGSGVPASFSVVHTLAKVCGATTEESRDLLRLWALADASRTAAEPVAAATTAHTGAATTAAVGDGSAGSQTQPTAAPPAREAVRRRASWRLLLAGAVIAALAIGGTVVLLISRGGPASSTHPRDGAVPIHVFNVERGCQPLTERIPACSLGLARNPRVKYDKNNVVSHRVWHKDVLYADCTLYDGDRVDDETGVGTSRWFRVRLDDVPEGVAWLPAVRTRDNPQLPTCA